MEMGEEEGERRMGKENGKGEEERRRGKEKEWEVEEVYRNIKKVGKKEEIEGERTAVSEGRTTKEKKENEGKRKT